MKVPNWLFECFAILSYQVEHDMLDSKVGQVWHGKSFDAC